MRSGVEWVGQGPRPSWALVEGRRATVFVEMFLGGEDILHDFAIEDAAERPNICDLRVVLEPDWVRKTSPGEGELRLDQAGDHDFVRGGAGPLLVLIPFEVIRFILTSDHHP